MRTLQRNRELWALLLALLCLGPGTGLSPVFAQDQGSYRILVTNDDGIESAGIKTLVKELARVGEVTVSAPLGNRSGTSHSISVTSGSAFRVRTLEMEGAAVALAVDATPADAVSFGILTRGAQDAFDLVVSGINRGSNVGNVAHYSGTVGAAMEAAYHGLPAVAVSQDRSLSDFVLAARFTAELAALLKEEGAPRGVVLSINVPAAAADGLKEAVIASMGGSFFRVSGYRRVRQEGRDELWSAIPRLESEAPPGSDTEAYFDGNITITPLRFDWTHLDLKQELQGWAHRIHQRLSPAPE